MERIKTLKTASLCESAKTAAAASARLHVSPPARPAVVLQTRNARTKTNNYVRTHRTNKQNCRPKGRQYLCDRSEADAQSLPPAPNAAQDTLNPWRNKHGTSVSA